MRRREALTTLLGALLVACGGARRPGTNSPPSSLSPSPSPLHLDPATDLAQAPGLTWILDLRLREIFADADLIEPLNLVFPEGNLDAFRARNGGIDLRALHELTVAAYRDALLVIGRGDIAPARVEKAFTDRADSIDGRARDRADGGDPSRAPTPITRLWGTVRGRREQLAIFGHAGFALERGRFGPLRASELFAQSKLKRARPALRAAPLDRAVELLGDAPARGFAPGPFEGEWERGLGGLLKASTAVAVSARRVRDVDANAPDAPDAPDAAKGGDTHGGSAPPPSAPAPPREAKKPRLDVRLLLLGGWGADSGLAAGRLSAAYGRLASDPLGRLCALDRPLRPVQVRGTDEALILEVGLDPLELARGLRAATEASAAEVMAY